MWDEAAGLSLLLDDGVTRYVWGTEPISQTNRDGSKLYYTHQDGLGSVRALSNPLGLRVSVREYDPFGRARETHGAWYSIFGFAGEQRDASVGLYYLRIGEYELTAGKDLTRDRCFQSSVAARGEN